MSVRSTSLVNAQASAPCQVWHGDQVSFDVFFQGFIEGDAAAGGLEQMMEVGATVSATGQLERGREIVIGNLHGGRAGRRRARSARPGRLALPPP